MRVKLVVTREVRFARRVTEPRHMAQQRLPDPPPQCRPAEENLVVEAGREKRRQPADERREIETNTWPCVLARRDKPVIKCDIGGAAVRLGQFPWAELNKRRRLLHSRGENPARAMEFEAARDQPDAVC